MTSNLHPGDNNMTFEELSRRAVFDCPECGVDISKCTCGSLNGRYCSPHLHPLPCSKCAEFDGHDWEECWYCGGTGLDDLTCECEAFVDTYTCCCLHPTPARCETCNGKGGWHVYHAAHDNHRGL